MTSALQPGNSWCIRLITALVLCLSLSFSTKADTNVYESPLPVPAPANRLDRLYQAKLNELGIRPILCSDAVFVRRAYVDIIGTLPTAAEAREFLLDPDQAKKRSKLIDRLMERDEFADYWAMRWGDVLRIKAEFPVNLWPNAAQAYHRWVHASIAENKPYDRFARELLTSSGSNFRVGPANFYRAIQNRTPEGIASAVALTFMGTRTEKWPTNQLAGMAAFFAQVGYKPTSEWKEEHVFWDPLGASHLPENGAPGRASLTLTNAPTVSRQQPTNRPPTEAVFPDGTRINLPQDRDPREVFADWLVSPKNPWFTRSVVNRVWYWFVGRGIIHEPDDIRPDNPASNPDLLALVEKELIKSSYDLKHLYRVILNSQAYQASSVPHHTGPQAESNFASYPLRRLDAEVLIDAINKITGTSELYTSPIPEPFTYIPEDKPAIAIADGSITSPFLALFGRSARATGMENERNNKPLPAQWLYLLNSTQIQRKLEQGPGLKAIIESARPPREILDQLYLTVLSRFPTSEELQAVESYGIILTPPPPVNKAAKGQGKAANKAPAKAMTPVRREAWQDVAWALINSSEFLYRH